MKDLLASLLLFASPAFAQVIAIRAGADIVAMPANPMDDIENLRKIDFVMKEGKIVPKPTLH